MSIASLMKQMRELGAPIEAIEVAVAAVEAARAENEAYNAKVAARSALYRARGGGKIPLYLRAEVFLRDQYRCVYCGSDDEAGLHVDHITPVSQGGGTWLGNLATACRSCNVSKGNRTPEQWGREWPI